jgi:glycosyltransferase involved in cell wall biosynthesis
MMPVSVVMACYNGRPHILRQLASLAAQRCQPAELVVTDDGSDDDTPSVVAEFARTAPFPVRLYSNNQRLGFRANFMRGTELSRSELIAFCDQDDFWYPNKLGACVSRFDDPETVLVYHNADVIAEDGSVLGSMGRFAPGNGIIPVAATPALTANPYGFTMVFRRSLLEYSDLWPMSLDHNWPGKPMAHDQWIYFLACVFGSVGYVNERLVAYVQHGRNLIGWRGRRPWSRRLSSVFENYAEKYRRYSTAAERRAAILDLLRSRCGPAAATRAALAAERLRYLSSLLAERSVLYSAGDFHERARAFWNVIAQDGYRGGHGLNSSSLLKDACLGVLISPILPRHEPS